jgi:ubiquinone/menaquinone biosynthesis C-methylase UbiE
MDYLYFFTCDAKLFSHAEAAKTKYWQDEAREFLKFLPKASTTLEVACGEGEFTRVLRSKLSNVEGTDLVKRGDVKHVQDYSKSPVRDEKGAIIEYDLVVVKQGLEHILDYLGAMWNMIRNARVGGYVAIDYYSAKKFVPSMIHYFHIEILKEIAQKFGCRYVVGSGFDVYTYLLFTKIKKIANPYEALLVGGGPQGASELWTEALGKPPKEDVE